MRNSERKSVQFFYPIKPNNQRNTTDRCWFIAYAVMSFVVLSSLFYSFILEKDQNFWHPIDPDGRYCTLTEDGKYPYIYFPEPDPSLDSLKKAICINKCPHSQIDPTIECLPNTRVPSCSSTRFYQTRQNTLRRYCEPVSESLRTMIKQNIVESSKINQFYFEVEKLLDEKIAICVLCPALCIGIMLFQLLLIYNCGDLKGLFVLNFAAFLVVMLYLGFRMVFIEEHERNWVFVGLGILILIASLAIILDVIGHRHNFKQSLEYLNICSQFIFQNKRLIFLPLAMFFAWALSFVVVLTVFNFIFAIGASKFTGGEQYVSPFHLNESNGVLIAVLFGTVLVHYIWTCLIIQHLGKYVAIVGASNWLMHAPRHFKNALFTLCKYHLGSVLMGSCLITLFSWVVEVLYFFVPDRNNKLLCCHSPSLNSFYSSKLFLNYIGPCTEMTYLKMGIDGTQFQEAGMGITPYQVKNIKVLPQTYKLSKLIVKSCQLFVALLTTLICLEFLLKSGEHQNSLLFIIIIFFISMLLSSFGQDPYSKAYETLLLTVMINQDVNNTGSKQINSIAQFPSSRSMSTDHRMELYGKIKNWINQQYFQYEHPQP